MQQQLQLGDAPLALQALTTHEALHPYQNWAYMLEDADRVLEALSVLETLQRLNPNNIKCCYDLARIYGKLNHYEEALEQYQKQLTLEIEESYQAGQEGIPDPWTHNNIALVYLQLGRPQQAKGHLKLAIKTAAESCAAQYALLVLEILD